MKAEYYDIRKNSTRFSNNGIRFKGNVVRIWRVTGSRDSNGRIHTHTHTHTHTHKW